MPAKRFSELALWLTFQMDGDFLKLRFMESISRFRNCLVRRLVRSITVRRTSGLGM